VGRLMTTRDSVRIVHIQAETWNRDWWQAETRVRMVHLEVEIWSGDRWLDSQSWWCIFRLGSELGTSWLGRSAAHSTTILGQYTFHSFLVLHLILDSDYAAERFAWLKW
jgi:hypothetical protein